MSKHSTGAQRSRQHRIRPFVLERDDYTCQQCGFTGPAELLTVDHIRPLMIGGKTVMENLRTLCYPCHIKRNKTASGHIQNVNRGRSKLDESRLIG